MFANKLMKQLSNLKDIDRDDLLDYVGLETKRSAAESLLPREIVWRKKAGFRAPVRAWLARELRPMVEDLLSPERVRRRGLFDYAEVRRIVDDNLSGREDNSLKVYQLLTLELWHEAFFGSRSPA